MPALSQASSSSRLDGFEISSEGLNPRSRYSLSDGFRLGSRCPVEHQAVVDGDARSAAIAAASVIAKVTRDRYMRRAEERYPGWDFAGNVGYSTPEHRSAITKIGICELHRRSFASTAYVQLELGA